MSEETKINDRDKTKDQLINELAELRKAEILFKAQCDLGMSLSLIHELKETLRLCVDSAISISGMDCGGVYLVDDSGNLDMAFHIGLPPAFVKSSSHYDADSASARLVMTGNPIYSKHHELGISLDKTREKEHLKAIAVVPVPHKNRVIACLNIASHTLDEVPDYTRTALEAIASQIGNSIIRSKMEEALKQSEAQYRNLIEQSNDAIYLLYDNKFEIINRRFTEMFGYTEEETNAPDFDFKQLLAPESISIINERIRRAKKGQKLKPVYEFTAIDKEGNRLICETSVTYVDYKGGKATQGILRDITGRKKAEEQIKVSLKEKELLLRELYHRTKNNMQVISAMLTLQSSYINEKSTLSMFKEMQNRIQSMALVHQKLYQSQNLSSINIKEYINDLAALSMQSYKTSTDEISLILDIDNIFLSIDTAIPCGLILNELISNSLKYAFPDKEKGEIRIRFHKTKRGNIELELSDNGVGFPENFDLRHSKSLGLQSVFAIVEHQLQGKIKYEIKNGTVCRIKFKESLADLTY